TDSRGFRLFLFGARKIVTAQPRAAPETLAVPRNPPVARPIDLPGTPDRTGWPLFLTVSCTSPEKTDTEFQCCLVFDYGIRGTLSCCSALCSVTRSPMSITRLYSVS